MFRGQLKDASRCGNFSLHWRPVSDLLLLFFFYGPVVVSLAHSPFPFSILFNRHVKNVYDRLVHWKHKDIWFISCHAFLFLISKWTIFFCYLWNNKIPNDLYIFSTLTWRLPRLDKSIFHFSMNWCILRNDDKYGKQTYWVMGFKHRFRSAKLFAQTTFQGQLWHVWLICLFLDTNWKLLSILLVLINAFHFIKKEYFIYFSGIKYLLGLGRIKKTRKVNLIFILQIGKIRSADPLPTN